MAIGHYETYCDADLALSLDGYNYEGQNGKLGHIYKHVTTEEKLLAVGALAGGYDVLAMEGV